MGQAADTINGLLAENTALKTQLATAKAVPTLDAADQTAIAAGQAEITAFNAGNPAPDATVAAQAATPAV